jgi:hypothetical protein
MKSLKHKRIKRYKKQKISKSKNISSVRGLKIFSYKKNSTENH